MQCPRGTISQALISYTLTVRLHKAGHLLGIEILDHIIVAKIACVSLREHGTFNQ